MNGSRMLMGEIKTGIFQLLNLSWTKLKLNFRQQLMSINVMEKCKSTFLNRQMQATLFIFT